MRKVDQVVATEPQKPESALVESGEALVKKAAQSLRDAADGPDDPVQSFAAMNGVTPAVEEGTRAMQTDHEAVSKIANDLYRERCETGREGTAEDDWHRAEQIYRARRG